MKLCFYSEIGSYKFYFSSSSTYCYKYIGFMNEFFGIIKHSEFVMINLTYIKSS